MYLTFCLYFSSHLTSSLFWPTYPSLHIFFQVSRYTIKFNSTNILSVTSVRIIDVCDEEFSMWDSPLYYIISTPAGGFITYYLSLTEHLWHRSKKCLVAHNVLHKLPKCQKNSEVIYKFQNHAHKYMHTLRCSFNCTLTKEKKHNLC